ncbi:MAG: hypothetical protein AB1515_04615 [Nitrospirota bacterium]
MRVPRDQGLFFSVFFAAGVAAALGLWLSLPVTHHVELESDEDVEAVEPLVLEPAVTPEERIRRMEQALAMASAAIEQLEPSDEKKEPPAQEKKK